MTALIGGSLLLIAGAAVTLVIGWIGADPPLIWISIASSVAAAVLLALGYYRSSSEVAAQGIRVREVGEGDVVAVPDTRRYHTADCRYAKAKGAEIIPAAEAKKRAYDACTICKP